MRVTKTRRPLYEVLGYGASNAGMIAFKNCVKYINAHYGVTLELEDVKCEYSDCNEQCIKERCPSYITH